MVMSVFPPRDDTCPILIDNQITGETWEVLSPQSRGDAIERLLFGGHSGDFATEMEEPVQVCIYIFKDGPIRVRYYSDADPAVARRAMQDLIDQGVVSGEVSP